MRPITVNGFKGANAALDDLLLPEGFGTDSQNQRPGHSDLRPWYNPSTVATVPGGTQRLTIYRLGQDVASDANYWFQWTTVVNAVRGFESPDSTERTYYTGSGIPKWTDNNIGLSGGAPYPQTTRTLGVPTPTTALTAVQAVAGTGTDETDYWIYTWVNDLGWESAPSPVSNSLLIKPGATVNLTGFDTLPTLVGAETPNWGTTSLWKVRIYKTAVATSGATAFFFLRELVYGAALTQPIDDARALGADTLPSIGWLMPPTDAANLTKLWNGMTALTTGKSVRISEPYKNYTYPLKYEILLPDTPVALAVWQQTFLILTSGDVYLAQGSTPAGMDSQPQKLFEPCSSARSVVEFPGGVAWASPNGLQWYGVGGPRNLLEGVLDREQWQALVPSTIVASRYLGYYIGFYNAGAGLKGFVIDIANPGGIYWLSAGYNAVYRDALQDKLYVLNGTNIQLWNVVAADWMTASFTSKRHRQPSRVSIGAVEVIAKTYPVTIYLYADGSLWHTQSVVSDIPIRPPYKEAQDWQVKVSAAGPRVISIRLAKSVDDLKDAA